MHDLTGFQRDLLYVIAGNGGSNGLEIEGIVDEYYGENIHHGRLYQNLNTVVTEGLVTKEQFDGRSNSYSLSQRGQRELKARREWEDERLDQ